MDLARAELVDAQVDGARAQLAQPRHDEQRRRLHVVAEDACARPHVQLLAQVVRPRHALGHEVRVESVDRADHADVVRHACAALAASTSAFDDVKRRDRRVLLRHVAVGRALAAHRADRDDEVAHLDLGLRGAARAHAEERVHARARPAPRRRSRPTGRPSRSRSSTPARRRRVPVKVRYSRLKATSFAPSRCLAIIGVRNGVARHEHVLADVALGEPDVVLLLRHAIGPSV